MQDQGRDQVSPTWPKPLTIKGVPPRSLVRYPNEIKYRRQRRQVKRLILQQRTYTMENNFRIYDREVELKYLRCSFILNMSHHLGLTLVDLDELGPGILGPGTPKIPFLQFAGILWSENLEQG